MPEGTVVRKAGTARRVVPGRQDSRQYPGQAGEAAGVAVAQLKLAYAEGHQTIAGFCEAIASVSSGHTAEIAR